MASPMMPSQTYHGQGPAFKPVREALTNQGTPQGAIPTAVGTTGSPWGSCLEIPCPIPQQIQPIASNQIVQSTQAFSGIITSPSHP